MNEYSLSEMLNCTCSTVAFPLYEFFPDLHVQQTPNPCAQDPDEVPSLVVHSELQNKQNYIVFHLWQKLYLFLLLGYAFFYTTLGWHEMHVK